MITKVPSHFFSLLVPLFLTFVLQKPSKASAFTNIYSMSKADSGHLLGERYDTEEDRHSIVLRGDLVLKKLVVLKNSMNGEFLIEKLKCQECHLSNSKLVHLKITDKKLYKKLNKVKAKQHDDFGEVIELENSTYTLVDASEKQPQKIKCKVQTRRFFSKKWQKMIDGFSLSCNGILNHTYIWAEEFFLP